jgi:hypothetical protein
MALIFFLAFLIAGAIIFRTSGANAVASSPNAAPCPPIPARNRYVRLLLDNTYELLDRDETLFRSPGFARELKFARKELALQKRLLSRRMRERREQHTRIWRFTPARVISGGSIGAIARIWQSHDHHVQRVALVQDLQPDELDRNELDSAITEIDQTLLRLAR